MYPYPTDRDIDPPTEEELEKEFDRINDEADQWYDEQQTLNI